MQVIWLKSELPRLVRQGVIQFRNRAHANHLLVHLNEPAPRTRKNKGVENGSK